MPIREGASRVLVVDDDRRFCGFLSRFLGREGFRTACVYDGRGMRRVIGESSFDLVLLDLAFPYGEDGISLMRGLRAELVMPLIVLSGNSTTIDKVVCLELGADDYVTKPFEPRELLARIRTVLRRATGAIQLRDGSMAPALGSVVSFAGWRVDLTRRELTSPSGQPVALTGHEFELLVALLRHPGHVLSRERILDLVAQRDYSPYDRSIDVLVGRLRRKLGDDARATRMIKTVRGAGYMFVAPAAG